MGLSYLTITFVKMDPNIYNLETLWPKCVVIVFSMMYSINGVAIQKWSDALCGTIMMFYIIFVYISYENERQGKVERLQKKHSLFHAEVERTLFQISNQPSL